MERTTAFSLSITGLLQAAGALPSAGVFTPDECIPGERYIAELGKRGVVIQESLA
jgi:lysine 6-dehydrogenase